MHVCSQYQASSFHGQLIVFWGGARARFHNLSMRLGHKDEAIIKIALLLLVMLTQMAQSFGAYPSF